MENRYKRLVIFMSFLLIFCGQIGAQQTKIRGFVDVGSNIENDKLSFDLGEYDLFITSDLNDNISFLGETVFKYDPTDNEFKVGIERVIINYNYKDNHSLLVGKQHTQINYWNESYHHGRVFFPTTGRPLLFEANFIPIHTTGIGLQGLNLGKLKFGYTLLIGNGLGSQEIKDNDKYKSVTAAVHIKPIDKLQIGFSYYNDIISEGAQIHKKYTVLEKIKQQLYTGSASYFGSKFEVLAEGTLMNNNTVGNGNNRSFASYIYAGIRLKEKWVPYVRLDYLDFQKVASYLGIDDTTSFITGLRYEINYLMVVKLEYQHDRRDSGSSNHISTQFAIGF